MEATELFEDAIEWLREHYGEFRFFAERDLVWTIQCRLLEQIEDNNLPLGVFNDHGIGRKRADLVVMDGDSVAIAVEFKYEPSHERDDRQGGDIRHTKFPAVVWAEVCADIDRVHEYVEQHQVRAGYSIFVDEGGAFSRRPAPVRSQWIDWGGRRSVLWSRSPGD
ncbi:MAG: hypothetical protein F4X26_05415 [Chloroflexi bacterium]|nr:hypothetical protein [Chloroflexota bacterium]